MSNVSVASNHQLALPNPGPVSPSTVPAPSVKADGAAVPPRQKPSRLWMWFIAAFVLQSAAWTTWFVIASHHKVAEVPLATHPAGRN